MAKTNDFKPVTFEKEINGKKVTRVANNASDAVAFKFDGFREVKAAKTSTGTSGGGSTAASKS